MIGIVLAVAVLGPAIWLCTNQEKGQEYTQADSIQGTSVWCSGSNNVDRLCHFKNLCFSSVYDSFLFIHAEESILNGIPYQRFEPALVDLSSVADHNTQYFHYVDVAVENVIYMPHRHHIYKTGKYLLFNRFNPSNLMHIFHDDLLPIFFTILHHDLSNVTLVAFEGWVEGEYFDLYRLFSKEEPVLKMDLMETGDGLTCFQEVYVGLSKLSTWYQYGFSTPQGPLPNLNVTSFHIKHFRERVQKMLNISKTCPSESMHGVIVSREENRLLLNEDDLALTISHVFNIRVVFLSLESQSLSEIIKGVSCAKILVGVHGSLLVLSMFLPPTSILLEIFPYAINPDHYTPYKTLVSLPGMNIVYASWHNTDVEKTVYHEDLPAEYGGITHMSEADQKRILESTEVPPHLCCSDPEWLFRIYQDTMVDVPAIIEILTKAMVQSSKQLDQEPKWSDDIAKHHIAPGFITDLKCLPSEKDETTSLLIKWSRPWNAAFIKLPQLQYEIWVQSPDDGKLDVFFTNETVLEITNAEDMPGYSVWVRAVAVQTKGPQSWTCC